MQIAHVYDFFVINDSVCEFGANEKGNKKKLNLADKHVKCYIIYNNWGALLNTENIQKRSGVKAISK